MVFWRRVLVLALVVLGVPIAAFLATWGAGLGSTMVYAFGWLLTAVILAAIWVDRRWSTTVIWWRSLAGVWLIVGAAAVIGSVYVVLVESSGAARMSRNQKRYRCSSIARPKTAMLNWPPTIVRCSL